jgi:hypothetical protein
MRTARQGRSTRSGEDTPQGPVCCTRPLVRSSGEAVTSRPVGTNPLEAFARTPASASDDGVDAGGHSSSEPARIRRRMSFLRRLPRSRDVTQKGLTIRAPLSSGWCSRKLLLTRWCVKRRRPAGRFCGYDSWHALHPSEIDGRRRSGLPGRPATRSTPRQGPTCRRLSLIPSAGIQPRALTHPRATAAPRMEGSCMRVPSQIGSARCAARPCRVG